MGGLFGTFNIAKSGIFAQQKAINVTSHNIANANTEGYSRQVATLTTTRPTTTNGLDAGQIGTGVQVDTISRVRDSFLDYHTRVEMGVQGKYSGRDEFLSQIENILNEPSDTGLSSLLGSFYSSWQQLSKSAETSSSKKVVAEQSLALTNELNHTYAEIQKLKSDTQSMIKDTVFDINSTLNQLSKLNQEIIQVKVSGQQPNDLMDKRDLLLDQLSSKFGIKIDKANFEGINVTSEESPEDPDVKNGGTAPVDGTTSKSLNLVQSLNPDSECRFSCISSITNGNGKAGFDSTATGPYKVTYYKNGDTANESNKVDIYVNITSEDQYKALDESRVLWADNDGNALSVDNSSLSTCSKTGIFDGGASTPGSTSATAVNFSNLKLFQPPSGELNGYMSVQKDIDDNTDELNKLAKSLAFSVNAIMTQSASYTSDDSVNGIYNFFVNASPDGTYDAADENAINAGNITVNKVLMKNNMLIQASTTSSSGESDGNRALAIAGLKDMRMLIQGADESCSRISFLSTDKITPTGDLFKTDTNIGSSGNFKNIVNSVNGMTLDNYFKDTIDRLGIQEQEAKRMVSNQESLLAGFQKSKASVSGVSLDEEMANLIQYQHAYQANSKVISTVDELLDVVINGLKK